MTIIVGDLIEELPIEPSEEVEIDRVLPLDRGWNLITIVSRDAAQNVTEADISVHLGVPIAGGGSHALALLDGDLFAAGRNNQGQLGVGDLTDRSVPTLTLAQGELVSLAAGLNHSVALSSDGLVYAWGRNNEQALGLGPGPDIESPSEVPGLPPIDSIAAGQRHTLAIDDDGGLWSWGSNSNGQLGRDGAEGVPGQVLGLGEVIAVAGGGAFTLVANGHGELYAFGKNSDGQLGDGALIDVAQPKKLDVLGLQVATGKAHGLTSPAPGSVLAWGLNASGQVGIGGEDDVPTPTLVALETTAVVAASGNFSFALVDDGSLHGFGQNFSGQLGLGDDEDRTEPAELLALTDVRGVALGLAHTLAIDTNGDVYAWGLNAFGQLGDDMKGTSSAEPKLWTEDP